jgi:hypothetical protein
MSDGAPPPIRGTEVVVQEVAADGARLAERAAPVDAGHLTSAPEVCRRRPGVRGGDGCW